jgi:hypothetical protein
MIRTLTDRKGARAVTRQSDSEKLQRVVEEGERFYTAHLRALLEPKHMGKFVAIEPQTGRYFIGKNGSEALTSARNAMPESVFYLKRVGFDFTHKIGGRSLSWGRKESG